MLKSQEQASVHTGRPIIARRSVANTTKRRAPGPGTVKYYHTLQPDGVTNSAQRVCVEFLTSGPIEASQASSLPFAQVLSLQANMMAERAVICGKEKNYGNRMAR